MQLDGQLLINGQYLKFESASNLQILDIKNTHNSTAPINAFITKNKNGGVGHSNDVIADFSFVSDDDQGDPFTFCGIKAEPLSVGDNAASGALEFNVLTASGGGQGNSTGLKIKGSSSTLNRVDLDIGNGATSLVTVAGNLQVTTDIVLGTTSLSGYFVPAYIHRKMGGSTTALAAEFNPWDTDNSTSNSYIGIPGAGVTYDSATGRFTVAAAGKYEIISVNYILSNSGTAVGHTLKIKKNGSDVLHTSEFMAHNAVDPVERTLMTMDALAANDYIEILADSDSTATLTFTPGTSISIKKIAS